MSVDSYRRDVQRHRQQIAKLLEQKAREFARAADLQRRANDEAESARRTTNASSAKSRLQSAQRYQADAARAHLKVAEVERQIAREEGRLNDTTRRLASAEDQERRTRTSEQERSAREHERRMRNITGQLTRHDAMHREVRSAVERLQQLPERIGVLFLAANPLDQPQLRLDEEVRAVEQKLRLSEHREAVELHSRWAVRPSDVLQAINETNPRIVHFSGHGSEDDELVLQGDAGETRLVTKEAMAQAIAFGSDKIQLVFFNACFSRGQAEAVVKHVPCAIGMNTAIGDEAARVFAAQFYSAIGFGHSVARAFQQAKAALMIEGIREEDTPELFVAEATSAEDVVLVRPSISGIAVGAGDEFVVRAP